MVRFLRQQRGVALMEFALVMPFLFLILFAGIELARFMVIAQRLDRAAYTMSDITVQYPPATVTRAPAEISQTKMNAEVFPQLSRVMGSFADATRQASIMSSVRKDPDGVIRIYWQMSGGGSYNDAITVSYVNGITPPAVTPAVQNQVAPFTPVAAEMAGMPIGENMIVGEIFYRYQPLIRTLLLGLPIPFDLGEITMARRMYFIPRNGVLRCLPNAFVDGSC